MGWCPDSSSAGDVRHCRDSKTMRARACIPPIQRRVPGSRRVSDWSPVHEHSESPWPAVRGQGRKARHLIRSHEVGPADLAKVIFIPKRRRAIPRSVPKIVQHVTGSRSPLSRVIGSDGAPMAPDPAEMSSPLAWSSALGAGSRPPRPALAPRSFAERQAKCSHPVTSPPSAEA